MKTPLLRVAGRAAFALLLAAAAAVLAIRLPDGADTDIAAMADAGDGTLHHVVRHFARRGCVVVSGPDAVRAQAAAEDFLRRHPLPRASAGDFVSEIALHRSGLISDDVRARLLAGDFASVARMAYARLAASPLPPLVSVRDDPFGLVSSFVSAFSMRKTGRWAWRNGHLRAAMDDGGEAILLDYDFGAASSGDMARLVSDIVADAPAVSVRFPECAAHLSGAPFHSVSAANASMREINALSMASFLVVMALGLFFFRSFKFVIPLACALASAGVFAIAALYLAFPRPHAVAFVFGTSLIGLSVDYVYHGLSAPWREVRRPMAASLATSVACLVPLLFASAPVLRQMALFTAVGLVAAFAFMALFHPAKAWRVRGGSGPSVACGAVWRRLRAFLMPVAVVLLGAGVFRVSLVSDFRAFYAPPQRLAADEAWCARAGGAVRSFAVIRAPDVQSALEAEEAAGLQGLSRVVPSLRRQRENAELVRRLVASQGKWFSSVTGIPVQETAATPPLDPEAAVSPLVRRLVDAAVVRTGEGVLLLSPAPEDASSSSGVEIIDPAKALADTGRRLLAETVRLAWCSALVLAIAILAVFRRRALSLVAPVAAALAAAVSSRGWLGMPLTFFDLLCLFAVAGLGFDYVVFRRFGSQDGSARAAVRVSFLTSFAGLGMLAFTSFPVTRSMGVTCALGLAFAYAFACIGGGGGRTCAPCDEPWYRQREQSAGRLRLALLWGVYRVLGKTAVKLATVPVMAFIYPFARPARAALAEFYAVLSEATGKRLAPTHMRLFRHLLGFAWSLADKTDAFTLRRSLPRVLPREDAGWLSFKRTVDGGGGAFIVASHLGAAEVLSAARGLTQRDPHMHAFRRMGHDAKFTAMLMRRFDSSRTTLHAVEAIGVETAAGMQDAVLRGELVLMAGDRPGGEGARTGEVEFLGRKCAWPRGVFSFARIVGAPVFFMVCVRTGWNRYEAHFESFGGDLSRRGSEHDLMAAFASFLEREVMDHPEQWYNFYPFFDT